MLLLCFIYLLYSRNENLKWILIIVMTLLGCLRGLYVGSDHAGYADDFYIFSSIEKAKDTLRHDFEYGYLALIGLWKTFSNDYILFSNSTFLIFMYGIIVWIQKYSINIALSLFLFYCLGFYFTGYNTMRQCIAMAAILASMPLLDKEKRGYLLFSLVTVTIAVLMHKSQVLLLLLIPIHYITEKKNIIISKFWLYLAVSLSFVLFFIGKQIILDQFSWLIVLVNMEDDYGYYIFSENEKAGYIRSLVYTLIAALCIFYKNQYSKNFHFYVYILGVVVYNLANMLGNAAIRMSTCFLIFQCICIPCIIYESSHKPKRFLLYMILLYGLADFFQSYYLSNLNMVNPYYFFFDQSYNNYSPW